MAARRLPTAIAPKINAVIADMVPIMGTAISARNQASDPTQGPRWVGQERSTS